MNTLKLLTNSVPALILLLSFVRAEADMPKTPSPDWKAGFAKVSITPSRSVWMAGFAARTKPSEGAHQELWAKALALDDGTKRPAVLVTADILGFPADLSQRIARRVRERYRIARDRLILNASHTHSGPVVGDTLRIAYPMTEEQWVEARAFTQTLEDKVVACIGSALKNMRPVQLAFGHTTAGFAMNRRKSINSNGPVDHDVPVLRIDSKTGQPMGVIFGYACHNTTLGGDNTHFHGDYSGVACEQLEQKHPGVMAMFVTGCGGDANPDPRGTLALVKQHGTSLTQAVDARLAQPLITVKGPLRTAWAEIPLKFAPTLNRAGWEEKRKAQDVYVQRHARMMLDIIDKKGRLPETYSYPVQVWQFGQDLTLIPMAGEVVVDYALRLKRELGAERTWVTGYSNDVFAYIPSLRVLREGGYEGEGAMLYYGQPGKFTEDVEETIIAKIHALVKQVQEKKP